VPKDGDGERFLLCSTAKAVEFKGFAGSVVPTNYCQQYDGGCVIPNKRPPHCSVRGPFLTLDVCK